MSLTSLAMPGTHLLKETSLVRTSWRSTALRATRRRARKLSCEYQLMRSFVLMRKA